METAVTGLDASMMVINSEIQNTVALLQKTSDITGKARIVEMIEKLSNVQKNFAETISILQEQAQDMFGDDFRDDPDNDDSFDDFDDDELTSFVNSKQIDFKNTKKTGKGKKKSIHHDEEDDDEEDDDDMPF